MLKQTQMTLKKCFDSTLMLSCILTCSLAMTTNALAGYKPSPNQKPPSGKATSTVARTGGCQSNNGPSLTALAPHSHVGQTISTHPTFAWFVPDSQPYPMEFRLYQYDAGGDAFGGLHQRTKIQTVKLQSRPRTMTLSLPKDQPGLSTGQRYHWQVVLLCNPTRPSSALVAEADIDVVEVPPVLARGLSATSNPQEKANLYAETGLWYDAFSEALAGTEDAAREVELLLLEDLARLEKTRELAADEVKQSTRIREIIEANGDMIYRGSSD